MLGLAKTPNAGRITQDFVFALITTLWLCFNMISFWFNILMTVSKSIQKMSQLRQEGCVTPSSRAKDLRAKKLGVPAGTLMSKDPASLVFACLGCSTDSVCVNFFGFPRPAGRASAYWARR